MIQEKINFEYVHGYKLLNKRFITGSLLIEPRVYVFAWFSIALNLYIAIFFELLTWVRIICTYRMEQFEALV